MMERSEDMNEGMGSEKNHEFDQSVEEQQHHQGDGDSREDDNNDVNGGNLDELDDGDVSEGKDQDASMEELASMEVQTERIDTTAIPPPATSSHPIDLPQSNIARIVRAALGPRIRVTKEALIAINRCAAVFVLYLSAATTDVARSKKRSTLRAEDVVEALRDCDFEEFIPAILQVQDEFAAEQEGKKKNVPDKIGDVGDGEGGDGEADGEMKKTRREGADDVGRVKGYGSSAVDDSAMN